MAQIQVMSAHLADLIAAGEVVERPGSVVKELLENAVDAGAKTVTTELRGGGMRLIQITDDGCGMDRADAQTAFLRHATSKLRDASELEAIGTLGFRGEALAAIAAVSRIEVLTRRAQDPEGTLLTLDGGVVTGCQAAGCPVGTRMTVRDLFYNTPARQKFMKKDAVEASNVFSVVQKQALANPRVSYRFIKEGAEVLHTPGDGALQGAVYSVLGRDAALGMAQVRGSFDAVTVNGFASLPTAARGNRNYQHFFVNGRWVKSKTLTAALEQAYRNQLMTGRYPACVLHLSLPLTQVDVNVHPAKTEVRFLSEKDVFDAVYYGVREALNQALDRPELALEGSPGRAQTAPKADFYQTMSAEEYRRRREPYSGLSAGVTEQVHILAAPRTSQPAAAPAKPVAVTSVPQSELPLDGGEAPAYRRKPEEPQGPARQEPAQTAPVGAFAAPIPAQTPALPFTGPDEAPAQLTLPVETAPDYRVAGEIFKTYIVVEQGDRVLLIDKHAAHERLLFERYRAQNAPIPAQTLLTPLVFTPDSRDAAALLEHPDLLAAYGYALEDFGDGALVVRQLPADLNPGQAAAALEALASTLAGGETADPAALRDQRLHTVACKAAIKAGDDTDPAQLQYLAGQVLSREDLQHCPHGRPVCVTLTQTAIERQFGRIV